MNNIIHIIRHSARAATVLLLALFTAQTAGAQESITGLTYNSAGGYYEISDAQDLVDLATYVNGGNKASGKTFKQTQNIGMSSIGNFTPIGKSSAYTFSGTYDGDNKTIANSGDGTHAGFVATNANTSGSNLTIEGCVFDGRLLGSTTNSCGGFLGWRYKAATIRNSLFAPTEVTVLNEGSATFARNTVDTYNCYYTLLLNDGTNYVPTYVGGTETPDLWYNGKATRTVSAADQYTTVAVALTGDETQYTVSGITAYSGGGLQRGQTLYYGSGDQLNAQEAFEYFCCLRPFWGEANSANHNPSVWLVGTVGLFKTLLG